MLTVVLQSFCVGLTGLKMVKCITFHIIDVIINMLKVYKCSVAETKELLGKKVVSFMNGLLEVQRN